MQLQVCGSGYQVHLPQIVIVKQHLGLGGFGKDNGLLEEGGKPAEVFT